MKARLSAVLVRYASLVFLIISFPALAQTSSTEVEAGVAAYKAAHYEEAISHFKKVVANEPESATAHLYLGTAYAQMLIPGSLEPGNIAMGEAAIEQFQAALADGPSAEQRNQALRDIASLFFSMKKFDEATDYYKQASQVDPDNPDNYYAIALIDWTRAYEPRVALRAKLGLKPTDVSEDPAYCAQIRGLNARIVEDGIENMKLAIKLRPDYDDAMAYMNLLYREKADVECEDPSARQADLKAAEHWVDETLRVKKAKAEHPADSR